jgi:hypothetical protein
VFLAVFSLYWGLHYTTVMFGPNVISNRYKGKVAPLSRTRPVSLIGSEEVKWVAFKIEALEDNLSFSYHSFNSRSWAPVYGAQETYTEHESYLRLPGRNEQLNIIFRSFGMSPSRECLSTKFTFKLTASVV